MDKYYISKEYPYGKPTWFWRATKAQWGNIVLAYSRAWNKPNGVISCYKYEDILKDNGFIEVNKDELFKIFPWVKKHIS